MPDQTLFVGNGPNRIPHDTHSWDAILQRLADFADQSDLFEQRKNKPFTLLFEEMALQANASGVSEAELKKKVATWMQELSTNWVHDRLLHLTTRHLLTANYDYAFEGRGHGQRADLSSETRYSLFRCREVGQKRVWHLHGEIDSPDTIVLGYEQYVGYLYKTRNYISLESHRAITGPYDHRSPVMHQRYEFEDRRDGIFSWVDVFLRDDIHIVGFGCDYGEIDIWWLLSLKERLRQRDRRLAKGIDVGRTIFYYFQTPHQSATTRAHLSALGNFGVDLVPIHVDATYANAWERLVQHLESAI